MLKLICAISAIALAGSVSAPALAQAQGPAPAAGQQQATNLDPNEVICQKHEITGSRLAAKKVCKTRAEWADSRLQDRQEIERVQTRRGMPGQ